MYFDAIAKIVSERTGCDVSAVKPESKFSELGIDSLDTVELLMNLEDEIGIEIEVTLEKYTGVKLFLSYVMKNADTGEIVVLATSTHCFVDKNGVPIAVKKFFPEFDEALIKKSKDRS